jgi:methylphosphotriester-DNA--protein-cysteine methyltransferase
MIQHQDINDTELRRLVRKRVIVLGGNKRLKIYGRLGCGSGKKMKRENRIFFSSEEDAAREGFRPCGHCMKVDYEKWRSRLTAVAGHRPPGM